MTEKISTNPLAQSLLIFCICAIGILAFVVLIILPSQKTSAELDREIDKLNARIEEQRILTPVFHSLLKRAKMAPSSALPAPENSESKQEASISAISETFQDIALRHNLRFEEIATDVGSMLQDTGYWIMRLRLVGDFYNFRDFLIDLGTIPSLVHIEEINIGSTEKSREMQLKIWLAQK
jgi:hypothetical protein